MEEEVSTGPSKEDSTTVRLLLDGKADAIRTLDILVYDSLGRLEDKRNTVFRTAIEMGLTKGDKTIAVIANSPNSLSKTALARLESIRLLSFDFKDDNEGFPLMGAMGTSEADSLKLSLRPLRSSVTLESISNSLDGYELLESPRIRLNYINASACLFRENDSYYPETVIEHGTWVSLPYDIGCTTQHPRTTLYCYPNDNPGEDQSPIQTEFELECTILGKRCNFTFPITSIPRGSETYVSMVVDSQSGFSHSSHTETHCP